VRTSTRASTSRGVWICSTELAGWSPPLSTSSLDGRALRALPSGRRTSYASQVAADLIAEAGLNERAATHVFALMHAAQFDAQLTCFETKYHYFVIRPSQAEPLITLVIPLPNYPANPSGHACLMSSGARVLEHFFPAHTTELESNVTEAGLSRIYAGIHYRFDVTAAWVLGRTVADWAISHEERLQ
jgi:hypothetical protein